MRSWTCLQPTDCRSDIPHDMAKIQSLLDFLQDIFESSGSSLLRLLCRTQLPHSGLQLLGWDSTVRHDDPGQLESAKVKNQTTYPRKKAYCVQSSRILSLHASRSAIALQCCDHFHHAMRALAQSLPSGSHPLLQCVRRHLHLTRSTVHRSYAASLPCTPPSQVQVRLGRAMLL